MVLGLPLLLVETDSVVARLGVVPIFSSSPARIPLYVASIIAALHVSVGEDCAKNFTWAAVR
jgi:hypothetical protein